MTLSKLKVPTHSLRVVFALSVFACSVVLVLFVRGRVAWTDGFWIELVAASATLAIAICFPVFRKGRMRLGNVPVGTFLRVFLPQLVLMYFASAIGITVVALGVVYAITSSATSSLALATVAGLWLALWFAPGIASLTSWHKLREAKGNET